MSRPHAQRKNPPAGSDRDRDPQIVIGRADDVPLATLIIGTSLSAIACLVASSGQPTSNHILPPGASARAISLRAPTGSGRRSSGVRQRTMSNADSAGAWRAVGSYSRTRGPAGAAVDA